MLWHCWLGSRKGIRPEKTEWWGADVVICLEQGADLHMVRLMPLPLTVSCFSKIQIGFTFLVPAHPGSPRQMSVKYVCVCVMIMVQHSWLYDSLKCLNSHISINAVVVFVFYCSILNLILNCWTFIGSMLPTYYADCRAGSLHLSDVLSLRPSVPAWAHSSKPTATGLLPRVRLAGNIDQLLHDA